ncbi:hypothetical protein AAE478_005684 [Parahypoxylon ruwenzoriense]
MEKILTPTARNPQQLQQQHPPRLARKVAGAALCAVTALVGGVFALHPHRPLAPGPVFSTARSLFSTAIPTRFEPVSPLTSPSPSAYGQFPLPNDPFSFIPCTSSSLPPPLDDENPKQTWAALFDPNPQNWSWGNSTLDNTEDNTEDDPYSGRGIYLCGYLDLPLDYLNDSDTRVVRLAVTKFQVSGLARVDSNNPLKSRHTLLSPPGGKSSRTIVIQPGGPGASGTSYVWTGAETVTKRFSDGLFDVLGWDPRGVNASLPAAACKHILQFPDPAFKVRRDYRDPNRRITKRLLSFPQNVYRDHWSLFRGQYREQVSAPTAQLQIADAMNNATFYACQQELGDFGRFVSTAFVARDLEEIRERLKEDQLTAYFVSYGTGIGQTYANMFPNSVGRMILDGPQYVKDQRLLGGFGWSSLDNVTDTWRDGFLGECLRAGPEFCALAKPTKNSGAPVILADLQARIDALLTSTIQRPISGYTKSTGPSLITYSMLVLGIYTSLYEPKTWPSIAEMLYELEMGNSASTAIFLERRWEYNPTISIAAPKKPSTDELPYLVLCADAFDATEPESGLSWWDSLWSNMTTQSWIAGNSRFLNVLPCRHFNTYWPNPAEVYRGDLNHTLSNPVLIVGVTYDPATPLRNGKRLLADMGENARLIIHHGYGHTSRWDPSDCTDSIGKAYILNGTLPRDQETDCYANESAYLYTAESKIFI